MEDIDERPCYDVVLHFQLPEGAGETLTGLIAGLIVNGPGWGWRVRSISPVGSVTGLYSFFDEERERPVPFMMVQWHKRGDGLGGLVTMQCEDESMWRAGVFHELLDKIVAVWPETKADIDRALGIVREEEKPIDDSMSTKKAQKKRGGHFAYDEKEREQLVIKYRQQRGEVTKTQFAETHGITQRTFRAYLNEFPAEPET